MVINTKGNHPPRPQPSTPRNFRKTKAQPLKKPRTTRNKTDKHTAPHIVQQNKQQQTHFRTLNHHQKMTLALIKTNLKEQKNHQVYNSNQQQQEYRETETAQSVQGAESKMGTHLTIIGVFTTICPENSGM